MISRICLLLLFAFSARLSASELGDQLAVRVEVVDGIIIASLRNGGEHDATVSAGHLVAGRGGGNVLLMFVSSFGQLIPPCSTTTPSDDIFDVQALEKGDSVEIIRAGISSMSRLHCLDQGRYKLVVTYQSPSGRLYFSNQTTVIVAPDGSAVVDVAYETTPPRI